VHFIGSIKKKRKNQNREQIHYHVLLNRNALLINATDGRLSSIEHKQDPSNNTAYSAATDAFFNTTDDLNLAVLTYTYNNDSEITSRSRPIYSLPGTLTRTVTLGAGWCLSNSTRDGFHAEEISISREIVPAHGGENGEAEESLLPDQPGLERPDHRAAGRVENGVREKGPAGRDYHETRGGVFLSTLRRLADRRFFRSVEKMRAESSPPGEGRSVGSPERIQFDLSL